MAKNKSKAKSTRKQTDKPVGKAAETKAQIKKGAAPVGKKPADMAEAVVAKIDNAAKAIKESAPEPTPMAEKKVSAAPGRISKPTEQKATGSSGQPQQPTSKAEPQSVSVFAASKAQHGAEKPGGGALAGNGPNPAYQAGLEYSFFNNAFIALSLAALVGLAMGIFQQAATGGKEAIMLLSGLGDPSTISAPDGAIRWAGFFDTLFPVFYGAGLVSLIAGYTRKGHRALFGVLYLLIAVVVLADFAENAMVISAATSIAGQGETGMAWLTMIKYAGLAFASVVTSAVIVETGALSRFSIMVLRFAFPVVIAFLVSGIAPEPASMIAGIVFLGTLVLLAHLARENRNMITD